MPKTEQTPRQSKLQVELQEQKKKKQIQQKKLKKNDLRKLNLC